MEIVIRAEFLIEDLKERLFVNNDLHPMIAKAWKDDIRYFVENGIEYDNEKIYDFNNKEDLKECIDKGMDAEDIAYIVNRYRDDKNNTQFFTNNGVSWHILCKQDVINAISEKIEQIACNILKYPYKDAYAELYREFVVPMIEGQGY